MINKAIQAAIQAGAEILKVYARDFESYAKEDKSPLTEADLKAHEVIKQILNETNLPQLSEEGSKIPFEERSQWKQFWLIDPLDGTKEFIKRNGDFTVNIALIEGGEPVMGVIYVPVEKTLYFASKETGAKKLSNVDSYADFEARLHEAQSLPINHKRESYVVVGSRSHMSPETEAFIANIQTTQPPNSPTTQLPNLPTPQPPKPPIQILSRGSSLKLCMVAEGLADSYPRFAPTMEWDTAAGDAICRLAACSVVQYPEMTALQYNKENLLNPWFLVERSA